MKQFSKNEKSGNLQKDYENVLLLRGLAARNRYVLLLDIINGFLLKKQSPFADILHFLQDFLQEILHRALNLIHAEEGNDCCTTWKKGTSTIGKNISQSICRRYNCNNQSKTTKCFCYCVKDASGDYCTAEHQRGDYL